MTNEPAEPARVGLVFSGCHRRGGVERSIRELARRLPDRFAPAFVGEDFDPEGMERVAFEPIGGKPRGGLLAPWSFERRARQHLKATSLAVTVSFGANCPPGDILWVNSVHKAWLRHGRPIPTRIGAIPNATRYLMPRHQVLLEMERRYFGSRPRAVVAVSNQTAAELVELYGIDPDLITKIPNGYAASEFSAATSSARRSERRAELGLSDDDVVFLLVANELHRKGLKVLLEATARLGADFVQVHVVGRAPIDPYRPLIEELGLDGRVHWHGPAREVADWYAVGDLFVMPTQYEAFPLVVVEALASGLPVVTTAVAGSSEVIQSGVNGLLQQDPDDSEELADLLRQALDPDVRRAWRAAAPGTVAAQEWGQLGLRFADVLDRTLA